MRPSDLRVGYVYTGRGGKTRFIIDKSGGVITYVGDDGHRHDQSSRVFAEWAKEGDLPTKPSVVLSGGRILKNCPMCRSNRVYINSDHQAVVCFKCGFAGPSFVNTRSTNKKVSEDLMLAWWNALVPHDKNTTSRRVRWKMHPTGGFGSLFDGKFGRYTVCVSSADHKWVVWRNDFASGAQNWIKSGFSSAKDAMQYAAQLLIEVG